jgi:H+-transporting ATPase
VVELGLQNWIDAAVLFMIQMTNATIGWYETMKSTHAVEALKASLKPEATVRRDGAFVNVNAGELVPGDCVLLASGSAVPADCMVNAGRIEVDQAALTGAPHPPPPLPVLCPHAHRSHAATIRARVGTAQPLEPCRASQASRSP